MGNDSVAFHLLRLLQIKGIGPVRVRAIIDAAFREGGNPERGLNDNTWLRAWLTDDQLDELRGNQSESESLWDRLAAFGAKSIAISDPEYPPRLRSLLGKHAPPLLTVVGNVQLLSRLSVGFCGSRKASERGLQTARDISGQLTARDINVVSGHATGVDMATHHTALETGGTTTVVLAEGVLSFKPRMELRPYWDWQRVAVASEFLPTRHWSIGNAMQRNATICALSSAMILIEARGTGGSIEAGRKCLQLGIPLYAPVYEGMPEEATGNAELLGQGARPLMKSRARGAANMSPLFHQLAFGEGQPTGPPSGQLPLVGSLKE
jgi:DNA processing protein